MAQETLLIRSHLFVPILAAMLAACAVGPDYRAPILATPRQWEAPRPHDGDSASLLNWWSSFGDPTLTELQSRAESDSPTLDQAVARITQARATLASARAQGLPNVNGSASYTASGQRTEAAGKTVQASGSSRLGVLDASWEVDLFGKVRRSSEAAQARVQARVNDWHDARVSLAAEVADDYVQYRGCEQLLEVYRQQTQSQDATANLTRLSANAGFTAPADAELAEASAASLRSAYVDQHSQCDLLVKTLVSLTGSDESELRRLLAAKAGVLPKPSRLEVANTPAAVVRQRPDVAASERELAATGAEIGVAKADLFPSLTLSGTISLSSSVQQWSFGPTLSLPIFDGGQRRAKVASARAAFDLQYASYRQTVRSAVLEVEQALVRLDAAQARERDAERAAAGYQSSFQATEAMRRAGSASMLERENAYRNTLDAQRTLINLRIAQVREWIGLYKAVGGDWGPLLDSPAPKAVNAGDQTP